MDVRSKSPVYFLLVAPASNEYVLSFLYKDCIVLSLDSHSLVFSFKYSFNLIFYLSSPSIFSLSCSISIIDNLNSLIYWFFFLIILFKLSISALVPCESKIYRFRLLISKILLCSSCSNPNILCSNSLISRDFFSRVFLSCCIS